MLAVDAANSGIPGRAIMQGFCTQCNDEHTWLAVWKYDGEGLPDSLRVSMEEQGYLLRDNLFLMTHANGLLVKAVHEQGRYLSHIANHLAGDDYQTELIPLIIGVLDCIDSLIHLANAGRSNAALIIGRSMLERVVNFKYLLRAPQEERKTFDQYFLARLAEKTDISSEVGQWRMMLRLQGWTLDDAPEEIKEAVARFTNRKGRVQTQWTDLSIERRLRKMLEWDPQMDLLNEVFSWFAIYRDASEAVHGSTYGALVDKGLWPLPKSPKEMTRNVNSSLTLGLLSAWTLTYGLIRFIQCDGTGDQIKADATDCFKRRLQELHEHLDSKDGV